MVEGTSSEPASGAVLVLRRFVGGTVGGVFLAMCCHPLDTLKIRVQRGDYKSLSKCFWGTWRGDGIRGFYRGVTPPLIFGGLYNANLFSINRAMTVLVTPRGHPANAPLPVWRIVLAAELTAPVYVVTFSPVELIKLRLQAQSQQPGKKLYSGALDCLLKVLREDGVRGLSRGYTATLASRVVGLPFYFVVYDVSKSTLSRWVAPRDMPARPAPQWVSLVSGSLAGLAFWTSFYPLDVLKTVVQSTPGPAQPLTQVVKRCFSGRSFASVYSGVSACWLRCIPANCALWYGIDKTEKFMAQHGW